MNQVFYYYHLQGSLIDGTFSPIGEFRFSVRHRPFLTFSNKMLPWTEVVIQITSYTILNTMKISMRANMRATMSATVDTTTQALLKLWKTRMRRSGTPSFKSSEESSCGIPGSFREGFICTNNSYVQNVVLSVVSVWITMQLWTSFLFSSRPRNVGCVN